MKHVIFTALLLCILPRPVAAQDEESIHVGVKGFEDTYHADREAQRLDVVKKQSAWRSIY